MTNEEINEKIAKLYPYKNKYEDGEFLDFDWAGSIEDAWKLLEEMPNAILGHYNSGELGKTRYAYRIALATNVLFGIVYESTAPRTICLAWLKFKENNK